MRRAIEELKEKNERQKGGKKGRGKDGNNDRRKEGRGRLIRNQK